MKPRKPAAQLNRRCDPLTDATIAQIQALPVEKLEAMDAWLDAWLDTWLAANASFHPLFCNCAGICTAVQIQDVQIPGGAEIVMAPP